MNLTRDVNDQGYAITFVRTSPLVGVSPVRTFNTALQERGNVRGSGHVVVEYLKHLSVRCIVKAIPQCRTHLSESPLKTNYGELACRPTRNRGKSTMRPKRFFFAGG